MPIISNNIANAINKLSEILKTVTIQKSLATAFFYISSSSVTTTTVADTYYTLAGNFGSISATDFTISSSGLITYTGVLPITIHLTVSLCIISDTNNVKVAFLPALNGSIDSRFVLCSTLATSGDTKTVSGSGSISMNNGDTLQIYIACDNAGTEITGEKALISIHSVY